MDRPTSLARRVPQRAPTFSLIVALVAGQAAGCAGTTHTTTTTPPSAAELLRRRAADNPRDAAIQTRLAELEVLGEGGDPARGRAAVDRALALGHTPRLLLLSAWEHDAHGRVSAALDDVIAAVDAAREATDDWSPVIAEVALDWLRRLVGEVPRYDERVVPMLTRVVESPGQLGHAALDAAAQSLIQHHRRAGHREQADEVAEVLGCLSSWRAAGAFGPYTNLSFDRTLPAQGAGPMTGPFDLGPGHREEAVFEPEVRGCVVRAHQREGRRGGSTVAETTLEVEHAGAHLLRIDTAASYRIYIDGEQVMVVDRRDHLEPVYAFVPVELAAGSHEVELVLMTSGNPQFTLAVDHPGRVGADYRPERGASIPEGEGSLDLLVRAYALQGRGDPAAASEAVRHVPDNAEAGAVSLVHLAGITGSDPFTTEDRREQRTDLLMDYALARDAGLWEPAVSRLRRVSDENELFEGLRALTERFPEVVSLRRFLAHAYAVRGQPVEAEATWRAIRDFLPGQCGPIEALQELLAEQGRSREANALVDDVMACDATSHARLALLMDQRRWDEARAELERLRPELTDAQARQMGRQLAIGSGDRAEAERLRAEAEAEAPEGRAVTVGRIDRLLARGRSAEAVAVLDAAAERDPTGMEGLRSLRRDLTGRDDLERYRVDGETFLNGYREAGDAYPDAPQVLVLDYMVTRIYPDGSARHLVHQIIRVQSEEARERLSTVNIRGRLLTLRSIKPDGRVLEPERIAGVGGFPMTDLAVGDYVEYEYIRSDRPRLNGGFLSSGWVFASTYQPFHHTEMVVVVPDGVELTLETTGPVPEPTEQRDGSVRVMRWAMERVAPYTPEPGAVPHPRIIPSLRFGVDAGWEPELLAQLEFVRSRDPAHPEARRVCREVMGDASDLEERVARLARWVIDEIESAAGWGGSAPGMVMARRGQRSRVLRYLLNMCGIPAQLALVRGIHEQDPGPLSRDDLYDTSFVYVPLEGAEPLYVWTGTDDAPWRMIPTGYLGQEAVLLTEGLPRVRLPNESPVPHRHAYTIDLTVSATGAADIVVDIQYEGALSAFWRDRLAQVPEAELDRVLREGFVSTLFPGAETRSFELGGRTEPDAPVSIRFDARVPRLGRPGGGGWQLPLLFPANPAGRYAQLPRRTTALGVGAARQRVLTRVHGVPNAAASAAALPALELEGPLGARYVRRARVQDGVLVIEREFVMPEANLPAAEYERFAAFCRAVSEAERAEVPLVSAAPAITSR